MDLNRLETALRNAHAAGDTQAATRLAGALKQARQTTAPATVSPVEAQPVESQEYSALAAPRKLLKGATFNFGDEIQAGIGAAAAFPFVKDRKGFSGLKDLYIEGRDELRAEDKAFSEANPKTALALELSGGLTTGGLGAAKVGAAKSIPKLMAFGGGVGGVSGYGASEADNAKGQLVDTMIGTGTGAALGAAAKPAGELVKKGVDKISPVISRMLPNSQEKARTQILTELRRSGMSPAEAAAELERNPNLMLGDLSENLRQRTASVATLPGKASEIAEETLTQRSRSQIDRIVPAIREGLGEDARYLDAVSDLQSSMRTRAKPLYDQAYETPVVLTGKMKTILERAPKEAFPKARKLAASEGVSFDKNGIYESKKWKPFYGEVAPENADVRTLDYIQRGISDIEGKALRSGQMQKARALGNVRRELVSEIDSQNPSFAQARGVWSGGKADEEAIEIGKKALRQDSESLRSQVKNMSESELKHFRIGVMKAIEDSVEGTSVTRDLVKKFKDVPKINRALRTAFRNEDAYKGFMRTLDDEAVMMDTYSKARTGSRTTPLSESNAELKKGFFTTAMKALLTSGGSLKYDAATAGSKRLFTPIESKNESVRGLMGDMLMESDPKKLLSKLTAPIAKNKQLEGLAKAIGSSQGQGALIGGGVTAKNY